MAGHHWIRLVERRLAKDDRKKHDTDMIILHDVDLTRVFRDEFAKHADKIQETLPSFLPQSRFVIPSGVEKSLIVKTEEMSRLRST